MVICPSCGTANGPAAKFCSECGMALAAAPAAAREERRTVTVLFADLAGFTARAEAMDPEDVRAFLHPWYELLEREVTGYGGTVERHLGDGVMALFGAPVAHEDDPERAVRAALRILERLPSLGLELHARLGINTGEVLFAAATGLGREDAVTGDAVNTAARLQAAAPVDGVVVGEATWRATASSIRYEPMEPIAAKGKAEPVSAWRPRAAIAHPSGELHAEMTPFVGRAFELESLVRLFERSRSTPSLEVVTIVADPGLGKSRLVRELARHVDALPELVTWRVGRCLPYGEGIGFWALGEIIKAQAGILDTDDQVTLSAKLDAVLVEPDPSLRAWMKDRIGPLVGLAVTTEPPQQEEAYTAWRRFLESIAATGPLVLIIEDLHWADDALVAFLQHVAANTAGLPILLVSTARPEVEERHPGWLARARRHTVLSLDALGDRDMSALVEATLPGATPELVSAVLDRAAGSPLYAEQLAAMLRDRPAGEPLDETAIPPTIAALLAARIDALPPEAKAVLLDASVIGKTFWSGAVAALGNRERARIEPLLAELARRDLVRPAIPSSMAGELEYAFVHALVRDVAYGELPRVSRALRHVAAAEWLSARSGSGGDDLAELLAGHYGLAAGLAREAGDHQLASKTTWEAAKWLRVAGVAATEVGAPTKAEQLIAQALALTEAGDPARDRLLARYGEALLGCGRLEEADAVLAEAAESLRRSGDVRGLARALTRRSTVMAGLGTPFNTALDAEAVALLEPLGPSPELVDALAELAAAKAFEDDLTASLEVSDRALAMAHQLGVEPPARLLSDRAEVLHETGDPRAAEVLQVVQADRMTAADHGSLAWIVASFQGPSAARPHLLAAERLARARGHTGGLRYIVTDLHDLARHHGEPETTTPTLPEVRASFLEHHAQMGVMLVDLIGVDAALTAGRPDEASTLAERSLAMALESGVSQNILFTSLVAARARSATGDRSGVLALLRDLDERVVNRSQHFFVWDLPELVRIAVKNNAADLGARLLQGVRTAIPLNGVAVTMAKATLQEAGGDPQAAEESYHAALEGWRTLGVPREEAHALAGLGRCLLARGETEEGVARLREAREIWKRLRATPRIADIDALLATVE